MKTQHAFPLDIPNNSGDYDANYFTDWIHTLSSSLSVPALPLATAWTDACAAVQDADVTLSQATNLRSVLNQKNDDSSNNKAILEQATAVVNAAQKTLDSCLATCLELARSMVSQLEQDDKVEDDDWILWSLLVQAGPKYLADFCASSPTSATLLMTGLANAPLLRSIRQAGGPKQGAIGHALQLLQQLGPTPDVVLHKLALAVALEFATPMTFYPVNNVTKIDPLQRFLHYSQAYLLGELDPAFSDFTVWQLRMAIDSDASDEELGWGRQCLKNYRPDIVLSDDPQWRYCWIVRSDVVYKHPEWIDPQHRFADILSGGGECGPRAWYGRFICKTFGIPTWGVKQPGHAAMARWTTQGWMMALGAGFQYSTWDGRCGLDFLLETQARAAVDEDQYLQQILRLEMLALFHGEKNTVIQSKYLPDAKAPWFSLALMNRQLLAKQPQPEERRFDTRAPNQIARLQNEPMVAEPITKDFETGTILVPASSSSKPTKTENHILITKSFLGGMQLYLGWNEPVEYTLSAEMVAARAYKVSVYMNSVHRGEKPMLLTVSSDATKDPVVAQIAIPYTRGMWQETDPVEVTLRASSTKLTLTRQMGNLGIAIKYIKLVPS